MILQKQNLSIGVIETDRINLLQTTQRFQRYESYPI
jgi:hypothetical protein